MIDKVYEVEGAFIHYDIVDGRRVYEIKEDGSIPFTKIECGIFSTLEKAEAEILREIEENKSFMDAIRWRKGAEYFAFTVVEVPIDEHEKAFLSGRTYDGTGKLHCVSDFDSNGVKVFSGREEPLKDIKEGEFCLILSYNSIYPAYVLNTPPTKKELNARYKYGYKGDYTDDAGTIMTYDNGHEHPNSTTFFQLSKLIDYEIPNGVKERILDNVQRYNKGELL